MIQKIILFTSAAILSLIITPCAYAQNNLFTGTVIYDLAAEGNLSPSERSAMPTTLTYKYASDKESMSLNFAMAEQRTIFDPETKIAKVLMDIMGKKIVINQTAAEVEQLRKHDGETVSVKETSETKNIAGYTCKKVILIKKRKNGQEVPSTLYYTDALDISRFSLFNAFPEVKGLPLEFQMKSGEVEFRVTARSIKKENIPSSEFIIGPEYQQFSAAEIQKFFGSMGLGK